MAHFGVADVPSWCVAARSSGLAEWCIHSPWSTRATGSVCADNEDGSPYRWDLTTNTLSQTLVLTGGALQPYTPAGAVVARPAESQSGDVRIRRAAPFQAVKGAAPGRAP